MLKTMEDMNEIVAKQDLDMFHYYNEIYNGFQGILLEIMKNYQYVGVKRKSGKNDQRESDGKSGLLATLDEIIKTEMPKEEKAMKKVMQFKKMSQAEENQPERPESTEKKGSNLVENVGRKVTQESRKVESQLVAGSEPVNSTSDRAGFIPAKADQQPAPLSTAPAPVQPPAPQPDTTERQIRASLSKAINSKPSVQAANLLSNVPEREDQKYPSYTIDPKMEKAIEINGDEGRPHAIHNTITSSERSNQLQTTFKTPQFKLLSIKHLNELIDDFFAKKLTWDENQGDPQATRSSAEDFLFIYLKKKYGLPELIMQNALAIVDSAKQYAGSDHKISLFHHVG